MVCSAFAALMAGCSDDEAGCPSGQTDCNGKCVDLATDEANCGECGKACGEGFLCSNSKCACPGTATDCDGTCTNTNTDPANCGSCGKACADGEVCSGGNCIAISECKSPKKVCGGSCIDVGSDNSNCGDCDVVCDTAKGFTCISGSCSCAGGMTDCSGTCVNTNTSAQHCGECGNACGEGAVCQAGECKTGDCELPLINCSGACVDPSSDPNNCGGCGTACETLNGFVCKSGQCDCAGTMTDCGGQCVDTQTNGNHCGECDNACTGGQACLGGECTFDCGTLTQCGTQCVDTTSSNSHCGECDLACTGGKLCTASECVCPTNLPDDCSGICTNLQTDAQNCNTCGNACPAGQSCIAGACTPTQMLSVAITCPESSVPDGTEMQCQATGTLQDSTTQQLTAAPNLVWSLENATPNATCKLPGDSGYAEDLLVAKVSNTAPDKGMFTAIKPACSVSLKATYTAGTQTIVSNVVTIGIVAKQILSVAISPDAPSVPWLRGDAPLHINFKVMATYDSGQVLEAPSNMYADWSIGNANVAVFTVTGTNVRNDVTGTAGLVGRVRAAATTAPTSDAQTTVSVSFCDAATCTITPKTAQTLLTVKPGNATGLSIAPATATIPLGPLDFTLIATFNNDLQFDVTDILMNAPDGLTFTKHYQNYVGLGLTEDLTVSGAPYFDDGTGGVLVSSLVLPTGALPYTPRKLRTTADKATPTNIQAKIKAAFTDTDPATTTTATAEALVTITDAALVECEIHQEGTTLGNFTDDSVLSVDNENNKFPVGRNDYKLVVVGHYSDGNADVLTDKVTYASSAGTIASVSNATGEEGWTDMLAIGTATITATHSASGVTCQAPVQVVGNQLCGLIVAPTYGGELGRRIYRWGTGDGSTGPLTNSEATLSNVLLPNMSGFSQQYRALAWYSNTTSCPSNCDVSWDENNWRFTSSGSKCFSTDVTSSATWELTHQFTAAPAVTSAGGGLFNVSPATIGTSNAAQANRWADVKATFVDVATVDDTKRLHVCGADAPLTAKIRSAFAPDAVSNAMANIAIGATTQYHLTAEFTTETAGTYCGTGGVNTYVLQLNEDNSSWTQGNAAIASVSPSAGSRGVVTGNAIGSTAISANYKGQLPNLNVQVADLAVESCTVTLPNADLYHGGEPAVGQAMQARVSALLTDGDTVDITDGFASNICVPEVSGVNTCSIAWGLTGGGYAGIDGGLVTANSPGGVDRTMGVTATCEGCVVGGGHVVCDVSPATPPTFKVKPATVASYFIQTEDKTCADEPAGNLKINTGTAIDLYGCVIFNHGAFMAVDNLGNNVAAATWSGGVSVTPDAQGVITATGTGNNTITSTYTVSGGGTFSDTIGIEVVTDPFTDLVIRGTNIGAAGCSSQPSPPSGGYQGCELEDTHVFYRLVGVRADNSEQDLTTMLAANAWTGTASVTFDGTIKGAATIPAVASNTNAVITVNTTAVPDATCDGGTCVNSVPATIRIFDADPTAASISVTAAPVTVAATGLSRVKVTANTNTSPAVTIDMTNDTVFAGDNPAAFFVYDAAGAASGINGVCLAMPVVANATATVTGTFDNEVTTPISGTVTLTATP